MFRSESPRAAGSLSGFTGYGCPSVLRSGSCPPAKPDFENLMSIGYASTSDTILDRAPAWGAVLAMSLCCMVLVASEFMPVSLLTPIASDLHMTEGQAGQAISISGIFAVLTSLSISGLTSEMGSANRPARVGPVADRLRYGRGSSRRTTRSSWLAGRSSASPSAGFGRCRPRPSCASCRRTACPGPWRSCKAERPCPPSSRRRWELSRRIHRVARRLLLRGAPGSHRAGLAAGKLPSMHSGRPTRLGQRVQAAPPARGRLRHGGDRRSSSWANSRCSPTCGRSSRR